MNVIENINAEVLDSSERIYDLSVCIITYNKVDYIRSAIESVLMQKTTCKYEIVIGDNQSTDGTKDVLYEYWKKYPEKIALILNDQNLGLTANMYNTMRKCKGKYIIILYGDDYWTSYKKMQDQYDFLEKNFKDWEPLYDEFITKLEAAGIKQVMEDRAAIYDEVRGK